MINVHRKSPFRARLVACAGLLLAAGLVLASAQNPAPPPGVDPKADEILRRMGKTLADARQFSFEVHDMADQLLENGQRVQVSKHGKIAVRRPDGIAAEVAGDQEDLRYIYNRDHVTIINRKENCYAKTTVPGTIDAMFDTLAEKYGITPPLADLAFSDPYKAMSERPRTGRYVGLHNVMGTKCHHLAFRQEGIDWQIWIEDGPRAVPRKLVITYKELPGYPQFIALMDKWDLDAKLPESMFDDTVPADCKRIDLVPRQAAPMQPVGR
jgi:hypothetical protein